MLRLYAFYGNYIQGALSSTCCAPAASRTLHRVVLPFWLRVQDAGWKPAPQTEEPATTPVWCGHPGCKIWAAGSSSDSLRVIPAIGQRTPELTKPALHCLPAIPIVRARDSLPKREPRCPA